MCSGLVANDGYDLPSVSPSAMIAGPGVKSRLGGIQTLLRYDGLWYVGVIFQSVQSFVSGLCCAVLYQTQWFLCSLEDLYGVL